MSGPTTTVLSAVIPGQVVRFVWRDAPEIPPREYTCGSCGANITSNKGFEGDSVPIGTSRKAYIYICHRCTIPTIFAQDSMGQWRQIPGAPFGEAVSHISDAHVAAIYDEARRATSANAYTAAVMCCRKLLMHLAVAKGATPNIGFKEYVDYLEAEHYMPRGSKEWFDSIRAKGNDVNHQIVMSSREDAEQLIGFLEMLLRLFYEFPAKMKPPSPSKAP